MQIQGSHPSSRWSKTHFENGHSSVLKDNTLHKLLARTRFLLKRKNNNNIIAAISANAESWSKMNGKWLTALRMRWSSPPKRRTVTRQRAFFRFHLIQSYLPWCWPRWATIALAKGASPPVPVSLSNATLAELIWTCEYFNIHFWVWECFHEFSYSPVSHSQGHILDVLSCSMHFHIFWSA